ncbi:MAG TPA: I78 family peptidase inhibitor [Allosphingosinicella sp.]|nr:I78 family peptidase inhibitor [Allosphingosinicella sp.]
MTRLMAGALMMMTMMTMMTGCANVPPAGAEEVPVRGAGTCDAAKAQKLIGRARSPDLGTEALSLTGARVVRWIPEGALVTMDYREDRVNLHLDGRNKVVKIVCG